MQYGMGSLPGKVRNLTVIYDNFLNDGSPEPPDEAVLSFLMKSGESSASSKLVYHAVHRSEKGCYWASASWGLAPHYFL